MPSIQMDVATATGAINGILAPAIMISSSALIILALHAKYSHLIDRLRALNDERRNLRGRIESLQAQITTIENPPGNLPAIPPSAAEQSGRPWMKVVARVAAALAAAALKGNYLKALELLTELGEIGAESTKPVEAPKHRGQELNRLRKRQTNVVDQIGMILQRARLVRNSIMSLYIAISLFVLSSIIIGLRLAFRLAIPVSPSLGVFMLAMLFVFIGTVYALRDIGLAFTVVQIEVRGVQELNAKKP